MCTSNIYLYIYALSDSTIEHVRMKLNEISAECNSAKVCEVDKAEPECDLDGMKKKEFILPEDVHFPLDTTPSLKRLAIEETTEKTTSNKNGRILSWEERSNLSTEGQRAVYR